MTTRQEKFEAERQKMLSQMGIENKEIEVEPEEVEVENGSEEIEVHGMDFSNVPNKADREALEAKEQEIHDEFEKNCDLILNNPEEYRKQKAQKRRLETKKPVNATGPINGMACDFIGKWGGGSFMWLVTFIFVIPVAISCFSDTAGRPLATRIVSPLVVFVFAWIMARIIAMLLSLIFAEDFARKIQQNGPMFLVDIRKGPSKSLFNFITPLMSFISNQKGIFIAILTMITIMAMGVAFYGSPTAAFYREGIKGLMIASGVSIFVAFCLWTIIYGIGYSIYSALAENTLKREKNTVYQLRYLHSPKRVMIAPRNGGFVSVSERLDAAIQAGG